MKPRDRQPVHFDFAGVRRIRPAYLRRFRRGRPDRGRILSN